MPGERIEYGIERQRHDGFVGRTALLARLDRLPAVDNTDRRAVGVNGDQLVLPNLDPLP
jgi:hypothetical protein